MQRIRALALTLLAVLAVSAGVAAAAQAAEGPFFKVAGVRLKAGESKELKAKATQSFELNVSSIVRTTCTAEKLAAGAKITGSTGANGSAGEQTLVFEGCTVAQNGPGCEVEHKQITTAPLLGELGYENSEATESKERGPVLMLLKPASGTWFATIKFVGSCNNREMRIYGSVIGGMFHAGAAIQVGKEPAEAFANELRFGVAHSQIWIEKAGVLSEVKQPHLEWLGNTLGLSGVSQLTLAGEPKWGVYTH